MGFCFDSDDDGVLIAGCIVAILVLFMAAELKSSTEILTPKPRKFYIVALSNFSLYISCRKESQQVKKIIQ